eukprot:6183364-Pleurochrysis_carterae.AAC.3
MAGCLHVHSEEFEDPRACKRVSICLRVACNVFDEGCEALVESLERIQSLTAMSLWCTYCILQSWLLYFFDLVTDMSCVLVIPIATTWQDRSSAKRRLLCWRYGLQGAGKSVCEQQYHVRPSMPS